MGKAITARKLVTLIKKGDVEGVAKSLEAGGEMQSLVDGISPLGWAVTENQPEIVLLLLESGADVESPQKNGSTPLQTCSVVRSEHLPDADAVVMADLLIKHGANVMACGDKYHACAPLAMAKMRGKKQLAALLTQHGAVAFDVVITMKNSQHKPLAGEFYYGIPNGEYPVAEADPAGKLKLENVFPGQFIVGYEGDEQLVTIDEKGSATPAELIWDTQ